MRQTSRLLPFCFLILLLLGADIALAQKGKLTVDYTVSLTDTSAQQFHVTTVKIGSRDSINYRLTEVARPSAQQQKIRDGWLKR